MGCIPASLQLLQAHIGHVGGFNNCRMMELGDQQMYCHPNIPEGSAAKSYFEQLGVKHTSLDLNGELGSLRVDLSKLVTRPDWMAAFDVVTDFGTSEHVGSSLEALYACRANCHNFCRAGGLLVSMNPKTGHWPGHGFHYFTKQHYERLSSICRYGVLELTEQPALNNTVDGWQIHAVLCRLDTEPFPSFDQFRTICDGTVFKT